LSIKLDKFVASRGFNTWEEFLDSCRQGIVNEIGIQEISPETLVEIASALPESGLHIHVGNGCLAVGREDKFSPEVVARDKESMATIKGELFQIIEEAISGHRLASTQRSSPAPVARRKYAKASHDSSGFDHMQAIEFVHFGTSDYEDDGQVYWAVVRLKGGGFSLVIQPPGAMFFMALGRTGAKELGLREIYASADDAREAVVAILRADGGQVEVLSREDWPNPHAPLPWVAPFTSGEYHRFEKTLSENSISDLDAIHFMLPASDWGIEGSVKVAGFKTKDGSHCAFMALERFFDDKDKHTQYIHCCRYEAANKFFDEMVRYAKANNIRPVKFHLARIRDDVVAATEPFPSKLSDDLLVTLGGSIYPRCFIRPVDHGIPFAYVCYLGTPPFICMLESATSTEDAEVIRQRMVSPYSVVRYAAPAEWLFLYNFISLEGRGEKLEFRAVCSVIEQIWRHENDAAFPGHNLRSPPVEIEVHGKMLHALPDNPFLAHDELTKRGYPAGPMVNADFVMNDICILFLGPPFLITRVVRAAQVAHERKPTHLQGDLWLADTHWFGAFRDGDLELIAPLLRPLTPQLNEGLNFLDKQAPGRGKYRM